jgi:hypothetical protein
MILGISRSSFTLIHVLVSLAAAGSGSVVLGGLLNHKLFNGWITTFYTNSVLTVTTGSLFPFDRLLHTHVLGLLLAFVVTIGVFVRVLSGLVGWWRTAYVLTLTTALYLDCYAAVVQLFTKVPALRTMAPTQTEPPFLSAQCVVLTFFVVLTYRAAKRFSVGPTRTAS